MRNKGRPTPTPYDLLQELQGCSTLSGIMKKKGSERRADNLFTMGAQGYLWLTVAH
jgi:hypothetical protein